MNTQTPGDAGSAGSAGWAGSARSAVLGADRRGPGAAPARDVVIVGGGISGLSAAWRLERAGVRACLIEAEESVGGCARTERRDGFLLEKGPFNVMVRDPAFQELLEDVAGDVRVVTAGPDARARYIYRRGRLHAVPSNPIALAASGLLSTGGKCRLVAGLIAGARSGPSEETIEQAATRRFGREVSDTLISAVIAGILAGDTSRLSLKACFPSVHRVDAAARSLLAYGVVSAFKAVRASGGKPKRRWRGLVSVDGGLGALMSTLGRRLGPDLMCGCRVTAISTAGGDTTGRSGHTGHNGTAWPWVVAYTDRLGEARTLRCRHLILAGSAADTSRLLRPVRAPAAGILDTIESASIVVLNLGFRGVDVDHPMRGYGFLVPRNEPDVPILGTLWADSIFPHHAPAGHRLIRVFLGGSRDPGAVDASEEMLLATAMDALRPLLGISGTPVLVDVCRYHAAIPQYHRGHEQKIGRLREAVATLPGLHLIGNYLTGVSVNDCVRGGVLMAERILDLPVGDGDPGERSRRPATCVV